jgi:protein-L-isoaspartate O-methyltransferase
MAWRLNSVLAHMHPRAIPASFRQRPAKKTKDIPLMQRPLPFAVVEILAAIKRTRNDAKLVSLGYSYASENKHAKAEAGRVLESIGGAQISAGEYRFDYDPTDVIYQIVTSGCIPEQRSHQYYPTPEKVARMAVELADIEPGHTVLEPSAGQGGLADVIHLHTGQMSCVEISDLNCKVLEAKGHRVTHADFLALHTNRELYDRVVMNPPFDQGRWQAHIDHASKMLKPGGRLVAIMPSGAKNRDILPGFALDWRGPFDNEFPGTSVSIVILTAKKPQ